MMNYCNPDCPVCGGIGYIGYYDGDDINHPEFGKAHPCPERHKLYWSEDMGIDREEAVALNWDKFMPTEICEELKELFTRLMEQKYGWAYVFGPPGIGKTLLAKAAVVRARYIHHLDARYMMHSTLLNHLRASYDHDDGQREYERRLKTYSTIPFLVLDEVGRDRVTNFGVSVLSDLLNARYEGATSKKTTTILLSNFAPETVLDDYQIDRIKDKRFDLLSLTGRSVRQIMTYEQAALFEDEPNWWQSL